MRKKITEFVLSWLCPSVLEREQRRSEMATVVQEHWKRYGPIHFYELIREEWDEEEDDDSYYVVFIDKDIEIDWLTKKEPSQDQSEAISYAESIAAKECKHLSKKHQLEFQRLIGQAIVCAIEGNLTISKQTAETARQSLQERTSEQSRQWTLTWTHIFLALDVFLFCRWQCEASHFIRWPVFGGIIGAYLSIVLKVGQGKWNAAAGLWIHIVEVLSRIAFGGVCGGLSYVILKSSLCPQIFIGAEQSTHLVFLFGVMAGFIERLIPRILSSYGETEREART